MNKIQSKSCRSAPGDIYTKLQIKSNQTAHNHSKKSQKHLQRSKMINHFLYFPRLFHNIPQFSQDPRPDYATFQARKFELWIPWLFSHPVTSSTPWRKRTNPLDCPLVRFSWNLMLIRSVTPMLSSASWRSWSVVHCMPHQTSILSTFSAGVWKKQCSELHSNA